MPGKYKHYDCCKYCGSKDDLWKSVRHNKHSGIDTEIIFPVCNKEECRNKFREERLSKRMASNIEKYGVAHVSQVESVKDKIKDTCVQKYGCSSPTQSPIVKKKIENTNIKKYGTKSVLKNEKIKEKIRQTNIERFGVDNPIKNKDIKAKAIETTRRNYGVDNAASSPEIQQKIKDHMLRAYGVDHPSKDPEIRARQVQGMIDKYGVPYSRMSKDISAKIDAEQRTATWSILTDRLKRRNIIPLFTKEEFIESGYDNKTYKCLHCNSEFKSDKYWRGIYCTCAKKRSSYEVEIVNWLTDIGISNIETNIKYYNEDTKKLRYEIDILLPDYNFGIDFHGVYWHSDIYKPNRKYCQEKVNFFKEKGIRIIQIFESEWIRDKTIIESIIKNILGMSESIYARKCELNYVTYKEAIEFLTNNHLQGKIAGSVNLGLYYNGELSALAVFGKTRFEDREGYELYRFCNKKFTNVVGGFNKLLKFFIKECDPNYISSYVDLRYFTGSGYKDTDFVQESVSDPNYFYFKISDKSLTLHSRVAFQKHKLAGKLEIFDPALSEYENMANNGYARIFDAGNIKMVLKLK